MQNACQWGTIDILTGGGKALDAVEAVEVVEAEWFSSHFIVSF